MKFPDEIFANFLVQESNESQEEGDNTEYVTCQEQRSYRSKQDHWIRCLSYEKWYHEGCSKFLGLCAQCGKESII
jgi:hypothetical protein